MPEISVIVPVYKVEDYLPDCIDSILKQSLSDFELILVDDGSPDRCGEICEEYARRDKRIKVFHQENRGLSGARNTGMDHAAGKYITFVDSDDVISPEYLRVLRDALLQNRAQIASTISCDVQDGDIEAYIASHPWREPQYQAFSASDALVRLYRGDAVVTIGSAGKMFTRQAIGELRFPVGRLHEDQAFTPLSIWQAKTIVVCLADLYYYRVRSDSITHQTFTAKRYDDLWAIDQCIAFFEAQNEAEIVAAAREKRYRILCAYSILAHADGIAPPAEYDVKPGTALRYLRKHTSDEKYTYYLSMIHPRRVLPHAYFRKLKQLLGLRGSADTNKP